LLTVTFNKTGGCIWRLNLVKQHAETTAMDVSRVTHSDAEETKADRKNGGSPNETRLKNKAERQSPIDYIYRRKKAELIHLLT